MVEVLPCRFCGGQPVKDDFGACLCPIHSCHARGPEDDEDGAKWNAMMRCEPPPAPPAAGTVRVRVPVVQFGKSERLEIFWQQERGGDSYYRYQDNEAARVVAWITADIPLPQPVDIPGTVEASDGE